MHVARVLLGRAMVTEKERYLSGLIDTHLHLIYPQQAGYGWTDNIAELANTAFTLADYHHLTATHNVVGALFMEAAADDGDYQAEARYIASLATEDSGLLGLIASCRPETDAGFDAWLDECQGLKVKGYRRILHVVPDAISQSETFRRNLQKIGARGQSFDMCVLARQLPIALDLAKACENTQLILDHCGVPDIAGGGFAPWRAHITALAALPHVACKISGVMAYCAPGQANIETVRPYIEHVIAAFGPDRLVWGSDWPVVNLAKGVRDWIGVSHQILSSLSQSEAAAIARENAKRLYQL